MSEAGGALQLPKKSLGDRIHAAVKIGVGQVPVVGGVLAELFAEFISPPLEKRKEKVFGEVLEVIEQLKAEKGITVEELQENPKFVDSVMSATRIAMQSNSEVKRAALKNAMFNSALPNSLEESKQQLYLHMVGELTDAHLQLLSVLDAPKTWFARQNRQTPVYHITGSIHRMLLEAYPVFRQDEELLEFVFKDLYLRALIGTEGLKVMMSGSGPLEERTTKLGRAFLRFVAEPTLW